MNALDWVLWLPALGSLLAVSGWSDRMSNRSSMLVWISLAMMGSFVLADSADTHPSTVPIRLLCGAALLTVWSSPTTRLYGLGLTGALLTVTADDVLQWIVGLQLLRVTRSLATDRGESVRAVVFDGAFQMFAVALWVITAGSPEFKPTTAADTSWMPLATLLFHVSCLLPIARRSTDSLLGLTALWPVLIHTSLLDDTALVGGWIGWTAIALVLGLRACEDLAREPRSALSRLIWIGVLVAMTGDRASVHAYALLGMAAILIEWSAKGGGVRSRASGLGSIVDTIALLAIVGCPFTLGFAIRWQTVSASAHPTLAIAWILATAVASVLALRRRTREAPPTGSFTQRCVIAIVILWLGLHPNGYLSCLGC